MGVIRGFFRLIRFFVVSGLLFLVLVAGMVTGGFFLLDYVVTGEKVTVPSLYRMSKPEALEELAKYELILNPDIEEHPNSEFPPGQVISQRPAPGSKVKKYRKITIVLSKGQEELFIPDFTGRREQEIVSDLRSASLEVGMRATVYHPKLLPGTVIAQEPQAGKHYLQGKKVNLLISLGPRLPGFVMPNLIGMDLDSARQRMQEKAFTIPPENVKFERTSDITKWYRVIDQLPAAGTKVSENENIRLTVGSSGLEISDLRGIDVVFPVPPETDTENLVILTWDEISQVFGDPSAIPIHPEYWRQEIRQRLYVFGDAFVVLAQKQAGEGTPIYDYLYFQYFPAR